MESLSFIVGLFWLYKCVRKPHLMTWQNMYKRVALGSAVSADKCFRLGWCCDCGAQDVGWWECFCVNSIIMQPDTLSLCSLYLYKCCIIIERQSDCSWFANIQAIKARQLPALMSNTVTIKQLLWVTICSDAVMDSKDRMFKLFHCTS